MIISSKKIFLVLLFIEVSFIKSGESLECYSCGNISDIQSCNSTVQCNTGESCHMSFESISGLFTMGCLQNQKCGSGVGAVVPVGRRQTKDCHECCSSDFCNNNLCSYHKPSACVDDEREDCAHLNSLFNICNDVAHAKLVCPKFCNLCHIVDGNWATWSNWSSCDVTCGNGTQIRTRTCTDPAPSGGGDPCVGTNTDNKQCINGEVCPVNGGWSIWSEWGSCSVSCDIGLQRRDRTCSNPPPSRFGDHCYGDARDDRLCLQSPCANGGWAEWGTWSNCSMACGVGINTRSRTCSNPKPSILGQYCIGDPMQAQVCNTNTCQNGGWAEWGAWSVCTMTCGGGIQTRSRTCSSPTPSVLGQSCVGDPMQAQSCNINRCPVAQSAFSVDHPFNYSSTLNNPSTVKLSFNNVIYEHGGDFDELSGTFTCSIPGTYYFSVTLVKKRSETGVNRVYCNLYKSGTYVIFIYVDPFDGDPDKGSAAVSQAAIIHLNKGDIVYLSGCSSSKDMEFWSSFSGFLLYPDN